ncbi:hypothetical protein NQ318_013147 [Aromia moschata]|uniref:THAP-type domain-containing protein n=1 Tax=Aromia moschata TaxID=1265417 RepID=A0AAV8Y2L3_9CUCU|nr:hypothetical protein NQ318_013147 [Aromia moschata]
MADNSLLTFQNNCESINRNGVEVKSNVQDTADGGVAAQEATINKQDDRPQDYMLRNSCDVPTRDDVVDEFLAGEDKPEFGDDLLLSNIEHDGEGIAFKSENTLADCGDGELGEKGGFPETLMENSRPVAHRSSPATFIAKNLKRRSIKWRADAKKGVRPPPYARVCSDHFSPDCYQRDLQHELLGLPLRRKLKSDAVPNQNLPGSDKKETSKNQNGNNKNENKNPPKKPRNENFRVFVDDSLPKRQPSKDVSVLNNVDQNFLVESSNKNSVHEKPCAREENGALKRNSTKSESELSKDDGEKARGQVAKTTRLPMRSSIRIAKKKSIECLSDSFTTKVNNTLLVEETNGKREQFSDKLRFMAKLHLRYDRSEESKGSLEDTHKEKGVSASGG